MYTFAANPPQRVHIVRSDNEPVLIANHLQQRLLDVYR